MSLLSQSDRTRIEAAIAAVEAKSAAELVVATVKQSGDYSLGRTVASALWAIGVAGVLFETLAPASRVWALVLQIPVGCAVWLLLGYPPLRRRLIPKDEAARKAQQTALRLFTERRVYETRDRTGVLLLISELEHQVVLLGDRGIHERVGTDGWQRHVNHLIGRIREGRAADGVIELIEALAPELGIALPVKHDDSNELPDQIVVDR